MGARRFLAWAILLGLAHPAAAETFPACPGSSIGLDLSADGAPFVRMRLGDRGGNFLVDTGTSFTAVDARIFGLTPGASATLSRSTFPTVATARVKVLDLQGHLAPQGGFAGIVGTDILRERVVAFRYEHTPPILTVLTGPCAPREMTAAGFAPVSLRGYDPKRAERVRAIWPGQPVLFIRIGGVQSPIGLDTGFSEPAPTPRPGTLQINEALLARLRGAGIAMHPEKSSRTIDCRGEAVEHAVWQVEEASLAFVSETGREIFRYRPPTLEVLPKSRGCGRVEAAAEPFGLAGAPFLQLWGTVIVDGRGEQVWLSQRSPKPIYHALAIARNADGNWDARADVSLEAARFGVLASCNQRHGACTLAAAAIDPARYQCIAIARGGGNARNLATVAASSRAEARQGALAACAAAAGASCRIEYVACNG